MKPVTEPLQSSKTAVGFVGEPIIQARGAISRGRLELAVGFIDRSPCRARRWGSGAGVLCASLADRRTARVTRGAAVGLPARVLEVMQFSWGAARSTITAATASPCRCCASFDAPPKSAW